MNMSLTSLISPDRIFCHQSLENKKQILEMISKISAKQLTSAISEQAIFTALIRREKLGCTHLNNTGIAVPHAKIPLEFNNFAICLQLATPIIYDDNDDQPVDLIFAFLLSEQAEDKQQNNEQFRSFIKNILNKALYKKLKNAKTALEFYQLLLIHFDEITNSE